MIDVTALSRLLITLGILIGVLVLAIAWRDIKKEQEDDEDM